MLHPQSNSAEQAALNLVTPQLQPTPSSEQGTLTQSKAPSQDPFWMGPEVPSGSHYYMKRISSIQDKSSTALTKLSTGGSLLAHLVSWDLGALTEDQLWFCSQC